MRAILGLGAVFEVEDEVLSGGSVVVEPLVLAFPVLVSEDLQTSKALAMTMKVTEPMRKNLRCYPKYRLS